MLGIIGGSLFYNVPGLTIVRRHTVQTPFGAPSGDIIEGQFDGNETPVYFVPRHGEGHILLPSEINYRANIWALKKLGVIKVMGTSAVGSLREDIAPGDLCLISQYFDHTRGKRDYSFFGEGVIAHVSTAEPTCPALSTDILKTAEGLDYKVHTDKTYACIEGPRFGTQAESYFLRSAGCDVVGMTNIPEAFLAREAQIGYCTIGIATDYDCWMNDPAQHAQSDQIIAIYQANLKKVIAIIQGLANSQLSDTPENIRTTLSHNLMTPREKLTPEQEEWFKVLAS